MECSPHQRGADTLELRRIPDSYFDNTECFRNGLLKVSANQGVIRRAAQIPMQHVRREQGRSPAPLERLARFCGLLSPSRDEDPFSVLIRVPSDETQGLEQRPSFRHGAPGIFTLLV